MSQASSRDHGDADAGDAGGSRVSEARGCEDGRDEQRSFIADAAGGVLVDGVRAQRFRVEDLAGGPHGVGQGSELGGIEPAK